ncbi:MAG: site-specific DNA-methyltransferase [Longimicrobiales bacterium]|nr:site-specific DNA-methyltransferase [Longimicrobiales bacterium]
MPAVKTFLSEVSAGLVPVTLWPYQEIGTTGDAKAEMLTLFPDTSPFSTPKPERLLQRIIHIATDPGDIVLDFFAGSGTTAAVAHKMGRRWITVERSEETVATYTFARLSKVVAGKDEGGITQQLEWKGGGGFRVLDVAPSMFHEEAGAVFLAPWAVGGDLAEVTAAQLGFAYDLELSPFCGRKGRHLLAVVDGRVNRAVVALLAGLLESRHTMILCGTSVDPEARDALPAGCILKKIPASILDQYRRGYLRRRNAELGVPPHEPVEPR